MVDREYQDLLSSVRLAKQRQGLIYDEFEQLMFQYGYCDNQTLLGPLQAVFKAFAVLVPENNTRSVVVKKSFTQF